MLQLLIEKSQGNPFAQGLHDCATLKNKTKHMALGLEFVDPDLDRNHSVCLGMTPIKDGLDVTGVAHIEAQVKLLTNNTLTHKEICHSTISDRATKGIARMFDHDSDVCQMHDSDKIARSAAGLLTRSRNKVSFCRINVPSTQHSLPLTLNPSKDCNESF